MTPTPRKKFTRTRLGEASQKQQAAYRARLRATPMIKVEGVSTGYFHLLSLVELRKLSIDERYQRIRVTTMVNELIHVLQTGGQVLDPATIAERSDGTWWIVDGQQRWWAHVETNTRMPAMIYKVRDFEAERNLFLAANRKVNVNSCITVKAWAGPIGEMIRKANDLGGPLEGLIGLERSGIKLFDASILARGILSVSVARVSSAVIERVLQRIDTEFAASAAALHRAEAFIQLLSAVFKDKPVRRLRILPMLALAGVARDRWIDARHPTVPDVMIIGRLRRTDWDEVVKGLAATAGRPSVLLPVYMQALERKWPTGR